MRSEYAVVSLGAYMGYYGVLTAANRAHHAVSMGLFDPVAGFPATTLTRGVSIMGGMYHSILGG